MRNQSNIHVKRSLHLHSTMQGTNPTYMSKRLCTYIRPCEEPIQHTCRKGFGLTSDHATNQSNIHVERALHLHLTMQGTNPAYMSEGLCTYIWPCEEPIQHTCQKGSALTYGHTRNQSSIHVRRALSPRMRIPGNWPGVSILPENGIQHFIDWSCGNTYLNHIRMALHLYLIMWEYIP